MQSEFARQRTKLLSGVAPVAGAFLAGGAVNSVFTDRPIADFDFYFKDLGSFERAIEDAYDDGFWCVHASERSVTFSDHGTMHQYMHFDWFSRAETVFDAFDFTVCMAAFDTDANAFVFHPTFLTDCAERRLRFHGGTRFPLISALRVLKYQDRGYKMPREDMLNLAMACARLDLKSWDDLDAQIGGLYGDRIKSLRDDGPFDLNRAIEAIARRRDEGQRPLQKMGAEREPYMADSEALIAHLRQTKGLPAKETVYA